MDGTAGGKGILHIFKLGGSLVEDEAVRRAFIAVLARTRRMALLVHGGGKAASEMSSRLGVPVQMREGRRITDAETLKIVTMVYAGWVNKSLVADLQAAGLDALGLTGADGNAIRAHKRRRGDIDYGFAGDIDEVNTALLRALIGSGLTPVIAPITHDGQGQLLNTNADTMAAETAAALAGEYRIRLCFLLDRPGVLADPGNPDSVIRRLTVGEIGDLHQRGVIADGMVPKLRNATRALEAGAEAVWLTDIYGLEDPAGRGTTLTLT